MKKKVIYIVSDVDKALAFEWIAHSLKEKFDLQFMLIGRSDSSLSRFLSQAGIPCHNINDEDFSTSIQKWFKLYSILKKERPDVVHVHLWRAMLLGLTASWIAGVKRRVLTRHHAILHYIDFPQGRKWDRLSNALATDIIAISENVKHILIDYDKADAKKVDVIHHGFDLAYFDIVDQARIQYMKQKYAATGRYPVVGVVARYMDWKGIQYIIPAFKKLITEFPNAYLILANAKGGFSNSIQELLKELPVGSYCEIPFEEDLAALYKVFDVYVHTPIDAESEAFGQTYVESLAAGVPAVFTLSGVASEFIVHEKNAMVVDYKNSEEIFYSIRRILTDETLRGELIAEGKESVTNRFNLQKMMNELERLYSM